jgi:hypothetical protein
MQTTLSNPRTWGRWKEAKRLALLAAFEDSATGTRIKEFRQDLSRQLGQHCQIVEHVWLFSMFRLRELQDIAAEEAAAADLVVMAAHDTESLPDEVKSWVDLWLRPGATRKAVLVALLDSGPGEARGPIEGYLEEVARRGGMEFLVESRAAS